MTKRLTRKIMVAILLLAAVVAVGGYAFSPSGDIDDYGRFVLRPSERPRTPGSIVVTFLGTTTMLFDDGETQLMIDGFLSRPSLRKVLTAPIETDTAVVDTVLCRVKAERVKALFAVHSHYDHVLDVAYIVQRTGAHLYGSDSTRQVGLGGGLGKDQMSLFEPGKDIPVGKFCVTVLSSKHSPPTIVNDDLGDVIDEPLRQPARSCAYKEGGAFDILIKHGDHVILVKPSANFIAGALDGVRADVLFLGTARLGKQCRAFQNAFYDETVKKVEPDLVIPVHWDNLLLPLSGHLSAPNSIMDDLPDAFDFLSRRLDHDGIQFGIVQGYQEVTLFEGDVSLTNH